MRTIPLTQGYFAKVDDEDFDSLSKFKWQVFITKINKYAQTRINGKTVLMHRMILNLKDRNVFADHIDHDGLNNQKYNLRPCNRSENQKNKRPRGASKFLGVFIQRTRVKHYLSTKKINKTYRYERWVAQINDNGQIHRLGSYKNEIDAAIAYDAAAKKYHGEFANLNFKLLTPY